MISRAKPRSLRQGYHHGDLRNALLAASLELIVEQGAASLSLREVARRAGVTHGAPYHHFADRAALLAAIAEEGFRLLADDLERGRDSAGEDTIDRMVGAGRGYVRFALSHPAHFQVMFRPELWKTESDSHRSEQGHRAFQVLVQLVLDCRDAGAIPGGPPGPAILALWAAVHGISSLIIDGPIPDDPDLFSQPQTPSDIGCVVASTMGEMMSAWGRVAGKQPAS